MLYKWYLSDLVNEVFNGIEKDYSTSWKRVEEEGGWKLSLIMPGIKKEDVEVTSGPGWSRVKYPNGNLKVSLPRDSDHEAIRAKLDLGILELFVPDQKQSGTRTIKVQ